jgi:hypothetical protein
MGQLIIDTGVEPNTTNFNQTERVSYTDNQGQTEEIFLVRESEQYNGIHHYEDANGVHQDLTLYDFNNPNPSLLPVTYRERLDRRNDVLKEIIVIRPDAVVKVVSEFNTFMKTRI